MTMYLQIADLFVSLCNSRPKVNSVKMMVDDDETFLYGSEDEETIPQPVGESLAIDLREIVLI